MLPQHCTPPAVVRAYDANQTVAVLFVRNGGIERTVCESCGHFTFRGLEGLSGKADRSNFERDVERTEETVALLRRFGADVNAVDRSALTGLSPTQALWDLIDRGDDAETAKLLLDKGADPGATFGRETLLERALFRQRWRIARQLADAGANLHPPDGAACAPAGRECHSIEAARLATLDPPTLAHLKARGLDRVAASGFTALGSLLIQPPPLRVAILSERVLPVTSARLAPVR